MPRVQRLSDLLEVHAEYALYYGFGGLLGLGLGGTLIYYQGDSAMFKPLGTILLLIGLVLVGYAVRSVWVVKDVTGVQVTCPFCQTVNELLKKPEGDFPCEKCARMVPISAGEVMEVHQVRCGFCNELNYYSDKTEALLCENCNHEIPIATSGDAPAKSIPKAYMVVDDESLYELILTDKGRKEEEVIGTLQHMLALNRNQVKQMLEELPITILTGITRKKAEILKTQLTMHDASVEMKPMEEARR
jgi:ribosomal protein L7/L12